MKKIILTVVLFVSSVAISAEMPNGQYSVDPDHASVGFSVSHLGVSNVQGRFNKFKGGLTFETNGNSSVEFEIDAASVDTNQPRRDDHIRSADFFDVASNPKITFKSEAITYSDSGDLAQIKGVLNLHGQARKVTFDIALIGSVEFPKGTLRVGFVAETKINRGDFGITAFPGVVGEEISITVNLEVIKN